MATLGGVAVNVVIGKEAFAGRFSVKAGETEDDDMDVGFAAGVAASGEGAMSKGNFQAGAIEENRPELSDLFTLRDGIRRDKTNVRFALLKIFAGFEKPCCDVVESAAGASEARDATNLCTLDLALILGSCEGRVSIDIRAIS